MKCEQCGSNQVNMYKEIRGIITEMEITRDDVKRELTETINSMVRSAVAEKIGPAIEERVKQIIRDLFTGYDPVGRKMLTAALEKEVGEVFANNFEITIKLKEKKEEEK